MSNDLTVSPVAAGLFNNSSAPREPTVAATAPASQVPEAQASTVLASPLITNPTLRLDAALGLVVVEYLNDHGSITTSIPSQHALAAYRRWDVTRCGPAPNGYGNMTAAPTRPVDQ